MWSQQFPKSHEKFPQQCTRQMDQWIYEPDALSWWAVGPRPLFSWVPIFGGDNLQFYPNFAHFSRLGDEPRPRFCSGKQIKWRPNKTRSSPKIERFFPRIQMDSYAQMHTKVNLLGGYADVDHTQTIGGIEPNYWGGYIPHPPGFRHPCLCSKAIILTTVTGTPQ